jgi:UDP:flavonoid glycosyltransferase YjiC (YdhE family)
MARTRRLLFVSVPLHGHINPLLEPARLLVQQGQCVLFVSFEDHRSVIEARGIPFKSLGPDCFDRKEQGHSDPNATKKAKMLASATLFTGIVNTALDTPVSLSKVQPAQQCQARAGPWHVLATWKSR